MHTIKYINKNYVIERNGIAQTFCGYLFELCTPSNMHILDNQPYKGKIVIEPGREAWLIKSNFYWFGLRKFDGLRPKHDKVFEYTIGKRTFKTDFNSCIKLLDQGLFDLPEITEQIRIKIRLYEKELL